MFPCPACADDSVIIETREQIGAIRRRRECKGCGQRWTTYESTVDPREYEEISERNKRIVELYKTLPASKIGPRFGITHRAVYAVLRRNGVLKEERPQ